MIKKSFVCLGLLLAGCTPQREYLFIAHFHNICNSPVQVIAQHYTNIYEPLETAILNVKAEIDETVLVLDTWSFNYNPEYGVAPIYKLELGSNGKQQSFDRDSFMAILKRSKYEFDGRHHLWTINDPLLCP
jgi:hypothetical protein